MIKSIWQNINNLWIKEKGEFLVLFFKCFWKYIKIKSEKIIKFITKPVINEHLPDTGPGRDAGYPELYDVILCLQWFPLNSRRETEKPALGTLGNQPQGMERNQNKISHVWTQWVSSALQSPEQLNCAGCLGIVLRKVLRAGHTPWYRDRVSHSTVGCGVTVRVSLPGLP